MNDANDIAKYIILKETISGRRITNLRLNAILFLIQVFHLHIFLKPCFKNKIYAWGCGPIVLDVYNKYKIYAGNKIPISVIDDNFKYNIDNSVEKLIDLILDNLKGIETSVIFDIIMKGKSYRIPFKWAMQKLHQSI